MDGLTYAKAGVDIGKENTTISALVKELGRTLRFRKGKIGESLIDIGLFAGVVRINDELALALSCDGVGTKILVARAMEKYDTIGIDLVAMNANDVICLGAEPFALLDYLAVEKPDPNIAREIGIGLAKGAEEACVCIAGGELAIVPEIVNGLDLAGMIVGSVRPDEIITGGGIEAGDSVIGLESTGIHSNGLTLARKVLLGEYEIGDKVFGDRSVGEELLVPTRIYVKPVMKLIDKLEIKGLANITGGGLDNLCRLTDKSYRLDFLPEPQPVFKEIQRLGKISDEEMYRTFNMGVGFSAVVSPEEEEDAIKIVEKMRIKAWKLGHVEERRQKVVAVATDDKKFKIS